MVTRTVNYTNLDGQECSEVVMFLMNKMDRIRFGNAHPHMEKEILDITERAKKIADDDLDGQAEVTTAFIDFLEDVVRASYGVRQGNKFVKTNDITSLFLDSEAYDEFVASLLTEDGALLSFLKELFPDADFSAVEM